MPFDKHRMIRLAEIAAVFGVAGLTLLLGQGLAGKGMISAQVPVIVANALMLLTVWVGLRVRGQGLDSLGLKFALPPWRHALGLLGKACLTLLFAVAAFVAAAIVMANLIGMPEQADMSEYNPLAGNLPLLLICLPGVWLFASLGEEILYRGFLIHRIEALGSWSRPWIAVCLSAVAFGVAHYTWGLAGVVQTTCMGLALGVAFLTAKRNLWVTVLAHGAMDTILFVQMYLRAPA